VVVTAGAADVTKPAGDSKRETPVAANANAPDAAVPQLGPNLNAGPEVPLARETNPPAGLVVETAPSAAQPRNTLWMMLAVFVVVVGGSLLKRLRSRRDQ